MVCRRRLAVHSCLLALLGVACTAHGAAPYSPQPAHPCCADEQGRACHPSPPPGHRRERGGGEGLVRLTRHPVGSVAPVTAGRALLDGRGSRETPATFTHPGCHLPTCPRACRVYSPCHSVVLVITYVKIPEYPQDIKKPSRASRAAQARGCRCAVAWVGSWPSLGQEWCGPGGLGGHVRRAETW